MKTLLLLSCLLALCLAGRKPRCADGSKPACADGSRPQKICADGRLLPRRGEGEARRVCADQSRPRRDWSSCPGEGAWACADDSTPSRGSN